MSLLTLINTERRFPVLCKHIDQTCTIIVSFALKSRLKALTVIVITVYCYTEQCTVVSFRHFPEFMSIYTFWMTNKQKVMGQKQGPTIRRECGQNPNKVAPHWKLPPLPWVVGSCYTPLSPDPPLYLLIFCFPGFGLQQPPCCPHTASSSSSDLAGHLVPLGRYRRHAN